LHVACMSHIFLTLSNNMLPSWPKWTNFFPRFWCSL